VATRRLELAPPDAGFVSDVTAELAHAWVSFVQCGKAMIPAVCR